MYTISHEINILMIDLKLFCFFFQAVEHVSSDLEIKDLNCKLKYHFEFCKTNMLHPARSFNKIVLLLMTECSIVLGFNLNVLL